MSDIVDRLNARGDESDVPFPDRLLLFEAAYEIRYERGYKHVFMVLSFALAGLGLFSIIAGATP